MLEAYAHARVDRPDKHLERRARLAGELKLVSELLTAIGAQDPSGVEACAARLRRLDAHTFDDDPDHEPVVPTTPTVTGVTDHHEDVDSRIAEPHDGERHDGEPADGEPADGKPADGELADDDGPPRATQR